MARLRWSHIGGIVVIDMSEELIVSVKDKENSMDTQRTVGKKKTLPSVLVISKASADKETKKKDITFRLQPEHKVRIDEIAKKTGQSRQSIINRMIEFGLQRARVNA